MSSHKRKRSASAASRSSSQAFSSDIINPHSYSESTIKQLHVAGLTDNDLLPSTYIPQFPHRPINSSHDPQSEETLEEGDSDDSQIDDDGDDDERASTTDASISTSIAQAKAKRAKAMRDAQNQQLGVVTNIILSALLKGDIARAKRAFGLLRRSEVRGKPVDLRRNGLWSLGAEILMRDGEDAQQQQQQQQPQEQEGEMPRRQQEQQQRRWGAAANMPQLRAYLEGLIRQYPYNRLHPRSISDIDFYPILFGCEFYNTWVEHRLAVERVEQDSEAWSDYDSDDIIPVEAYTDDYLENEYNNHNNSDEFHAPPHHHHHQQDLTGRERRLRQAKAEAGLRAQETMLDVANRMDALMENAPYKTNVEMLRLRGMVALYVGDLSMAPPPRTEEEEEEGKRTRDEERDRARRLFRRMRDQGGRIDAFTEKWLDGGRGEDSGGDEDEDEDYMDPAWSALPVFSSLPMR